MLISSLSFLTPKEKEAIHKLKIKTFEELIYYFPHRFLEAPKIKFIKDIKDGENVTILGNITKVEAKTGYYKGLKFAKATIDDGEDTVEAIWWNMPYVVKQLSEGNKITLTGVVTENKGKLVISNPKIEKNEGSVNLSGSLFEKKKDEPMTPIYGENKYTKSSQIRKIIEKALASSQFKHLQEIIPLSVSSKLSLPDRKNAIIRRHLPKTETDVTVTNKYLAFEEIFLMQTWRAYEKNLRKDEHSYKINLKKTFKRDLKNLLPFKLTKGQEDVLKVILKDLESDKPMSRLVEGDVGSGKTALALAATLATIETEAKNKKNLQVAYIAPTEILAKQHFDFFTKMFSKEHKYLGIALLTSSGALVWPSKINPNTYTNAPKSRVKNLLHDGRLNIVIGTHALFNKSILFEHLGLVIIDEQHRFGVNQRKALIEKTKEEIKPIPHLLSMSATPIPRTLALTVYGDLDLSVLDELPPGRKRAETKVVGKFERKTVYEKMEELLSKGKQAYVITPKIGGADSEDPTKSSTEYETKRMKELFPKYSIGVLHGKQSKADKEKVLSQFYDNKIQILVATTVIEVGISVPNATIILIENSETFGLAQLHQLRGRVERSSDNSYCFLMTESDKEKSLKRLSALQKENSGFKLAEIDLLERGPGSLIGKRQSGLTDIGMEAIKNRKLVEIAKEEAENLIKQDPILIKHKDLYNKIISFSFHEE